MFLFGNVLYVENIIDYLWISAPPRTCSARLRSAYALGSASDYEDEKLTQNEDYVQCDALSGSHIVKGSSPHIIGRCCALFRLCGSSSARPPTSTLCVGSVGPRRVTDEDASPHGSTSVGVSARPRHRSEVTRRSGEK